MIIVIITDEEDLTSKMSVLIIFMALFSIPN